MKIHLTHRIAGVLALCVCSVAVGADAPRSYADAEAIWRSSRDKAEYQGYSAEFAQYNNSLRLGFATIERVFFDVDNAKARCFERSYTGVRTKLPPFLPFVLQMGMG
jgi:hypothetical protein